VTTARCEWPNGNLELEDGTTVPNGCQEPAEFSLEGGNFCADHAGMVARGCLDSIQYTEGDTGRDKMEKVLLNRLLESQKETE
jgi:hypothetical protein